MSAPQIPRFKVTRIFKENYDAKERIIVNRGGTRSSKTYSLLQMLIFKIFEDPKKIRVLVCRQTLPSLKLSSKADFKEILENHNLTYLFRENKTDSFFTFLPTGTEIHFLSADKEQKVRGVKWDIIFLNEANEIKFDVFRQFILRTEAQIYIDFNPSDPSTWINTEIEQKRTDYRLIKSSYLDNPFLPESIIKEIEYLRESDKNYWYVFGLGEYGNIKNKIFGEHEVCTDSFFWSLQGDLFAGMDSGWENPSSLILLKYANERIYAHELFYGSHLTNQRIREKIKAVKEIKGHTPIYSDHNPSLISELRNNNIKALRAKKSSVIDSIRYMQGFPLTITSSSINFIREKNKYKFKEDVNGNVSDDPIKFDDHSCDAYRYGVYSHLNKRIRKIGVR